MNEPKWTAGQWVCADELLKPQLSYFNEWTQSIVDAKDREIVYVTGRDKEECVANALLIAASPALYEALQMLLDETNAGTWDCLPVEKARAALALARGEGV